MFLYLLSAQSARGDFWYKGTWNERVVQVQHVGCILPVPLYSHINDEH
jgi:hypothetical protein